ncbi:Tat pathway signal protein [Salinigranum rubrum]|uniref:Tat pathway signal protein n=1 Tax=Salinigranum rubrum TaxID=755307 RepID=A0A2I8VPX1_9EURY|nr:iron transporter [Salinigranum rubrum]AUV83924.1 Tat pathway signal protein [Salinigranum rubrum]
MNRRRFLGAVGAAGVAGLAGCAGFSTTTYSSEPPLVENPPDGVYVPSHIEGMEMVGMGMAGDARVAVTYSYPHRFWTVEQNGQEFTTQRVDIADDDAVHLMASVWDPETGVVLPNTGLSMEIRTDAGLVSQEVVYPMLSQQMGFHYGANFPLDGNDVYDVTVSVGAPSVERFGSLANRFTQPATATVSFDYREGARNEIEYTVFEESRRGQRDAVAPMSMEMMPVGRVPDSVPGTALGEATVGDLVLRGHVVDAERFGDDPYLVVTAATPYNDLVVPGMALSARVPGDGRAAFSGGLDPALDPDLGFHYGAPVSVSGGVDAVELTVEIPPQVARHEGYETAFLETGTVTLSA